MAQNYRKTTRRDDFDDDDRPQSSGLIRRILKWGVVLAIWGAIVVAGFGLWYGRDLIALTKKANFERKRAILVLANDGQTVLANYGETEGTRVNVRDLPPYVKNAVIAIEDRRFYYHFGVDPIGLARAAYINWKTGKVVQGGSTLTQQLAKNLFLKPERTMKRKIQEALLALWLETKYSKDEILNAYLNRVYFGAGAYGIDAASHVYFGKSAKELTLEESAMLAGLLKAPSRLSPENSRDRAIDRMNLVLSAMDDVGFLEEKEEVKGSRPVPSRKPISLRDTVTGSRYFADWVVDQANEIVGESGADLTIVTTLDAKLQRAAQDAVEASVAKFFENAKKPPQAAVVVMERSGAVAAMVGGRDYRASQFNRATQAMRQPGSSFKVFVYLAALEQGRLPGDLVDDSPIQLGNYMPTNHDGQYHGPVPLTGAFAMSLNTAAVRLASEVGIDAVIDTARRAGITDPLVPNYSLALGASEVTVLEMTSAYTTIANMGRQTKAYGIISIRDGSGEVLFRHESEPVAQVLDSAATARLIAMMQEVVYRGTGGRAYPGFPVAGKTGTSQNYRDTWFIGLSSNYVASVWMGNDDNAPMYKQYGGNAPADAFRQIIAAAEGGRPQTALTNANAWEASLTTTFSSDGLGGVIDRILGVAPQQTQPAPAKMKPVMDEPRYND